MNCLHFDINRIAAITISNKGKVYIPDVNYIKEVINRYDGISYVDSLSKVPLNDNSTTYIYIVKKEDDIENIILNSKNKLLLIVDFELGKDVLKVYHSGFMLNIAYYSIISNEIKLFFETLGFTKNHIVFDFFKNFTYNVYKKFLRKQKLDLLIQKI
jgi:hypothetical protein